MALRAVSLTAHMTSARSRMSQRVSITQLLTNHAVFSSWRQRGSQDFELHEVASVACRHVPQNILDAQKSLDFCTFFNRYSDYGTIIFLYSQHVINF